MEAENKFISKKELLAKYGISYGSLYRWKRKGLIPDEWFIRKATVTGQETFFPEELKFLRAILAPVKPSVDVYALFHRNMPFAYIDDPG